MSIMQRVNEQEIFVFAVEFGDGELTLHYQEKNKVGDDVMVQNQMALLVEGNEEREIVYAEIQDALTDLIDQALIDLRNPEY